MVPNEITWSHETRNLADLIPNPKNPRTITKENYKKLIKNIKRNGYANRLIINTDGMVLCGNQRLNALKELGYTAIDVLVPNEALTNEQIDDITVTDNLSAGAWDFDSLGNSWDPVKLIEWGMPPEWLGKSHFDVREEKELEKIKESKLKACPHCGELL